MKNIDSWQPSKFVYKKGKLKGSRNSSDLYVSSRLVADIVAAYYDENLKKFARGNLLDLGCGKVPFYEAYRNYISENTCIDWENTLHKNHHLDICADLNLPLPLKANQFDSLLLSDVLEHIKSPELLWNEMARVLKNDGILILNTPFYYWLHEEPHDYFRYTSHALINFAKNAGFDIIEVKSLGGVPEIVTDIFAKLAVSIPYIGKSISAFTQWTCYQFLKTIIGKKLSQKTSKKFPLGYALVAKKRNAVEGFA